jgi:hypothetical protein
MAFRIFTRSMANMKSPSKSNRAPLKDTALFSRFSIHPEFHTLIWPNGADFAPEFLHDNIRVVA